jgi:hypothetical protein
MIAAARFPLRSEPAKSQFLRPRAHGRIWLSAQLLSMGTARHQGSATALPSVSGCNQVLC